MSSALRSVRHEDQLSLVEHLDELRTRILVSLTAFIVCFGLALWQNDTILKIANEPFVQATSGKKAQGTLASARDYNQQIAALAKAQGALNDAIAADKAASPAVKAAAAAAALASQTVIDNVPSAERQPVTLGVAEPFTSTLRLAAYFAFLVGSPGTELEFAL